MQQFSFLNLHGILGFKFGLKFEPELECSQAEGEGGGLNILNGNLSIGRVPRISIQTLDRRFSKMHFGLPSGND